MYITLLLVMPVPEAFSPLPYLQMLQMVHQSVTVTRSGSAVGIALQRSCSLYGHSGGQGAEQLGGWRREMEQQSEITKR